MRIAIPLIVTIAACVVDASPVANAAPMPWCPLPHEPCWKSKRASEAFMEATHTSSVVARDAEPWCPLPHEPCWKSKRDAEAFIEEAGRLAARAAEPWCPLPHEPCWKSKREADAFASALGNGAFVEAL